MALNIDVYGLKIRVVVGYAPTECNSSTAQKDELYRNIHKAIKCDDKHRKLLILGDFNAQTGGFFQYSICLCGQMASTIKFKVKYNNKSDVVDK